MSSTSKDNVSFTGGHLERPLVKIEIFTGGCCHPLVKINVIFIGDTIFSLPGKKKEKCHEKLFFS